MVNKAAENILIFDRIKKRLKDKRLSAQAQQDSKILDKNVQLKPKTR